ncbi:hypothetical protein [Paenibacillus sp. UASWS1643]|uniref:hypothetical protein n=1 Tax=Paenibacillus sp. UASWS1643 TaxID=2580422 RepID=UPI0012393DD7|nr:hypothetical protein [Paenibacillus sp. UASWS1643]KAA8750173.1 hypothetical protein FE296_16400 [Paenibacillus sp. UASWS1643]
MSKQDNVRANNNGGIGIFGLLGVLFVALKLTGVITWSWWWVTLPFWGGIALLLVIIAIITLIALATDRK